MTQRANLYTPETNSFVKFTLENSSILESELSPVIGMTRFFTAVVRHLALNISGEEVLTTYLAVSAGFEPAV